MEKCAGSSALIRRGAWSSEEDGLLKSCIERFGEGNWHLVPSRAGLRRCRKSCRLRWLNYLKPGIKRGEFEDDEIDLILRLHRLLGNRWALIAGRIPGRTANDIKNYYNSHLSKKLRPRGETNGKVMVMKKRNKKKKKKKRTATANEKSSNGGKEGEEGARVLISRWEGDGKVIKPQALSLRSNYSFPAVAAPRTDEKQQQQQVEHVACCSEGEWWKGIQFDAEEHEGLDDGEISNLHFPGMEGKDGGGGGGLGAEEAELEEWSMDVDVLWKFISS